MRMMLALFLLLAASPVVALDAPKTDEQKTLYTIGQTVSRQLSVFNLTAAELEYVLLGLNDAHSGKNAEVDPAYSKKVQELARARRAAQGQKMAPANMQALEKASKEPGARKTATGMVFIPLKEGAGPQPKAGDTVRVNYRGTLADGKEFDSSYKRGNPLEFKLDTVIRCWSEGMQLMKVGGKAKLVCPAALAYGELGAGDLILPGATLLFEVELLDIKK